MTDEDLNRKYRKRSELCNKLTQLTTKSEINIENNPTVNIMPIASPTPPLEESKNYYHFNQNDGSSRGAGEGLATVSSIGVGEAIGIILTVGLFSILISDLVVSYNTMQPNLGLKTKVY
uniref:Uncharacterized protein n=1 Tax=Glossina austeni TaxID=7395 RepID=A0A1A9V468_GLOAU